MSSSTSDSPSNNAAVSMRRSINNRIAEAAMRFDLDHEGEFEFICECGEFSCDRRITMTLAKYRDCSPGSVLAH
jgi:hypothetical protein